MSYILRSWLKKEGETDRETEIIRWEGEIITERNKAKGILIQLLDLPIHK